MSVKLSPTFIDFQELKQRVKIEDATTLLDLKIKQSGGQMRSPCPVCQTGGDRALVITPARQAFYCFAAGQGGDVIALVAHVQQVSAKEAAAVLAEAFTVNFSPAKPSSSARAGAGSSSSTAPEKNKAGLNPLPYLQPEHPAVQVLGLSPQTCAHFGAGYAPKGIMRGRLAIPIHDREGVLLAYCGRAVNGESPVLIFPNGFNPAEIIFASHRASEGQLYLVRDPLQVLTAYESGVNNVVAFLTEVISPQQLEMLSSLMDERHCDAVELF